MCPSFGEGGAHHTDGGEARSRSSLNPIPDYREKPKTQTSEDKKRERMRQGSRYGVREYYAAKPAAQPFVPSEELPGDENPEDLLLQKEEYEEELRGGALNDDDREKRMREVEYVNKLDEVRRRSRREEEVVPVAQDKKAEVVHKPVLPGARQGGGERIGSPKAVVTEVGRGGIRKTRETKVWRRTGGRKPRDARDVRDIIR